MSYVLLESFNAVQNNTTLKQNGSSLLSMSCFNAVQNNTTLKPQIQKSNLITHNQQANPIIENILYI